MVLLTLSMFSFAEEQKVFLDCEYTRDRDDLKNAWNKRKKIRTATAMVETKGQQNIYVLDEETLEFSISTNKCSDVAINKVFV